MAAPGSLTARYEKLAGDETARLEAYVARTKLGFTIDEWRSLPWWQRRLYLEQMQAEHERSQAALAEARGESAPANAADALLTGSMDDLGALGFGTG